VIAAESLNAIHDRVDMLGISRTAGVFGVPSLLDEADQLGVVGGHDEIAGEIANQRSAVPLRQFDGLPLLRVHTAEPAFLAFVVQRGQVGPVEIVGGVVAFAGVAVVGSHVSVMLVDQLLPDVSGSHVVLQWGLCDGRNSVVILGVRQASGAIMPSFLQTVRRSSSVIASCQPPRTKIMIFPLSSESPSSQRASLQSSMLPKR
jgi:hypothetical protein